MATQIERDARKFEDTSSLCFFEIGECYIFASFSDRGSSNMPLDIRFEPAHLSSCRISISLCARYKCEVLTSLPTFRSKERRRLRKVGSRKFDYQEQCQSYLALSRSSPRLYGAQVDRPCPEHVDRWMGETLPVCSRQSHR